MSFFYSLLFILKIYCVYHVVKNDKSVLWIVVLIIVPGASLFYLFSQIVLKGDIKKISEEIKPILKPNSRIEDLEKQFRQTDNFKNKMALADAYFIVGRKEESLELYETCLDGVFKDDIHFRLQIGLCYFELKQYKNAALSLFEVKDTVEFKRSKYHLAYALSLDAIGKTELAKEQFEAMNSEVGNFEFRYHYARFLMDQQQAKEAQNILEQIIQEIETLDPAKKKNALVWQEKSEKLLHELESMEQNV